MILIWLCGGPGVVMSKVLPRLFEIFNINFKFIIGQMIPLSSSANELIAVGVKLVLLVGYIWPGAHHTNSISMEIQIEMEIVPSMVW